MNIYLDNAATTPVDPTVTEAMFDWQSQYFGNPSSPHKDGQTSRIKIESIRDKVASRIKCLSKEIIFTSGGTESNNKAVIGTAMANKSKGMHLVFSGVEHPSVLNTCTYLEKQGFEISYINPVDDGLFPLTELEQILRKDTILVSVMYVNNETGIIFPVNEIAAMCRDKSILFHCDAVQAFGKFELDVNKLGVDLLSFSAHKIYGPKGIGGLFIRDGIAVDGLTFGGGQEANKRAGTENLTGIVGLGEAVELMRSFEKDRFYVFELHELFEKLINEKIENSVINGNKVQRSPYISNISFIGVDNQSLLLNLDLNGLSASVGSACSSGSIKQSHVLRAMHLPDEIISSSVRFSFSRYNTKDDIENAVQLINNTVKKLR